jgi:hypothetical protein
VQGSFERFYRMVEELIEGRHGGITAKWAP